MSFHPDSSLLPLQRQIRCWRKEALKRIFGAEGPNEMFYCIRQGPLMSSGASKWWANSLAGQGSLGGLLTASQGQLRDQVESTHQREGLDRGLVEESGRVFYPGHNQE